jgi:anti-sigma regulatory factor (Ser/Thr protein kinase)
VHLLAELLDNAAAFSPPAAPIVVTGAGDGDDYLIEVTDRGLGMTDQELAWANQRLAARNGFAVRLGRSPAGGVTATVRVPSGLLTARAPVVARRG